MQSSPRAEMDLNADVSLTPRIVTTGVGRGNGPENGEGDRTRNKSQLPDV